MATDRDMVEMSKQKSGPSLFCFPAMSNFNGKKYPLDWVEEIQSTDHNYVLLDAAAFLSTNQLDLAVIKPAFIVLSFYKMFGYPTGLGALLVHKSSAEVLEKQYFGGGTVDVALVNKNFHVSRKQTSQKYEDGTSNYLGQLRFSLLSLHFPLHRNICSQVRIPGTEQSSWRSEVNIPTYREPRQLRQTRAESAGALQRSLRRHPLPPPPSLSRTSRQLQPPGPLQHHHRVLQPECAL